MSAKFVIWVIVVSVAVLGLAILFNRDNKEPDTVGSDVVATNGIHWHPKIKIFVNNKEISLEDDIGRKTTELFIHTHDEDYKEGIIHLEFGRIVKKDDIKLGKFFEIWGKEFNWSETTKMTVNGVENKEFKNYVMKDKDNIEVKFD